MQDQGNPSDFVARARRADFKQDVIEALDATEALYRQSKATPMQDWMALTPGQVDAIRRYLGEAYRALSNARHTITDAENDDNRS
jgi:hypothetical protein